MFARFVSRILTAGFLAVGGTMALPHVRADDTAAAAPARTFVGTVKNAVDSARVGLVADGGAYILYLCSQDEAFNRSSARWARGQVEGGKFEGKSPDGAMTVRGTIGKETCDGTISVGGKEMAFTAKIPDERTFAGLYRAEEKDGTVDYVAGWVVDEDDLVAGAVQNRQNRQITTPNGAQQRQPQNPRGNAAAPPRNPANPANPGTPPAGNATPPRGGRTVPNLQVGQGNGQGQQVTDPRNPATGAGKKFTAAEFQDQQAQAVSRVAAKGGSPLFAMTIQQVRRFLSGAQPSGALEQKTFAALRRVPRASLADYEKNWEKIPVNLRQSLLGPSAAQLTPTTPLTPELASSIMVIAVARRATAPVANANGVRSVRLTQIACLEPADVRKDEVFASFLVVSAETGFDNVTDIYSGLKKNDVRSLSARDSQLWPAQGATATATADIIVGAALFDDDSRLRRVVVDQIRALGDVAGAIASSLSNNDASTIGSDMGNVFDSIASVVDSARFIGFDTLVIRPNKQAVGLNGQAKNKLTFTKLGNNGAVRARYELRGLSVN